ncbi:MAG: thiamine phosphate synthase [Peptococcaceae bacterium]|nr:thiamine phosphate synthase [Peptococcaceae bacterium]
MLICVTNRKLCKDDFINRINEIAKGKPHAILLREKDLDISQYENLAKKVNEICVKNQVLLILNQNIQTAAKLELPLIHLSMPDLRKYKKEIKMFSGIGASVHSVHEAKEAHELGATYLIAGHVFSTECKKGVPPRGLTFIQEVSKAVTVPVFGIGGITKHNFRDVLDSGARGVCTMSEAMTCMKPAELADSFIRR